MNQLGKWSIIDSKTSCSPCSNERNPRSQFIAVVSNQPVWVGKHQLIRGNQGSFLPTHTRPVHWCSISFYVEFISHKMQQHIKDITGKKTDTGAWKKNRLAKQLHDYAMKLDYGLCERHLTLSETWDHFASRITSSWTSLRVYFTNWIVVKWRFSSFRS